MNLLSIRDLAVEDLLELTAGPLSARGQGNSRDFNSAPSGTMAFLFEQPSLRTMSSFAAAAVRVGLIPIPIATTGNQFRDQTEFQDEIQQLSLTSDCVVVRSHQTLPAGEFNLSPVPIINAGDGNNEHPTQTLIDLAVMRHFGLKGRTVVIMGNMRDHRTAHSLALALQRLGVRLRLISPAELSMGESYLNGSEVEIVHAEDLPTRDDALGDADFVYLLPTMSLTSPLRVCEEIYSFDLVQASRTLRPTAKIMHPFPRFGELSKDLDYSPFDAYHLQTSVGPIVRERLLRYLLSRQGAEVSHVVRRPIHA